jgi:hypothetical protein
MHLSQNYFYLYLHSRAAFLIYPIFLAKNDMPREKFSSLNKKFSVANH